MFLIFIKGLEAITAIAKIGDVPVVVPVIDTELKYTFVVEPAPPPKINPALKSVGVAVPPTP